MTSDGILAPAQPASFGRQYFAFMHMVVGCLGSVLDPRPDLAIPARRVTVPYLWWW